MLEVLTIVLNGMPFIQEHLPIFSRLNVPWRWHIVEGVALPEKCTGWCQPAQPDDHRNWLSKDGTTEYLDSIKSEQVVVYRNPGPWHGKLDMCNAPLVNIAKDAVIHEVDVDEFWSHTQLEVIHDLFTAQSAGRGWYYCDYYLGPDLHVTNYRHYPAHHQGTTWIRTHRYNGQPWQAHEPPTMPFTGHELFNDQTEKLGLVFKHFAYSTPEQLRFKENYYRRPGSLGAWYALQANTRWPTRPGNFLNWVGPTAVVDKTDHYSTVIKRLQTE